MSSQTPSNDEQSAAGRIELTTSRDDWTAVRKCFVEAFRRYPLYEYLAPADAGLRDRFLHAYLDANYDVTVGSGHGILLAIRASVNGETKTVGGVVFVLPSSDGAGWAIGSDQPYWDAYRKHGLDLISPEALERVERYEAWENSHVTRHIARHRSPLAMWNGLFCAIAPEHACRGLGRLVYKEAIRIMAQHWAAAASGKCSALPAPETPPAAAPPRWRRRLKLLKHPHMWALSARRCLPVVVVDRSERPRPPKINQSDGGGDISADPRAPLVVALSHSARSTAFHVANGFHRVALLPYRDLTDGAAPFDLHVLALDPFRTGRVPEFRQLLDVASFGCVDDVTTTTMTP